MNSRIATPLKAIYSGMWRFAIVSLLAFGFWAFEPKAFSEGGVFLGSFVFFVVFAEVLLVQLVDEPNRRFKFNRAFVPAFFAYASVWSLTWFALHIKSREWLGSALGCLVFAWLMSWLLLNREGLLKVAGFLIITHSLGYFLGAKAFYMARHPPAFIADWPKEDIWTVAKLAWGLCYGLGFGAGIGYAFHVFQRPPTKVD